MKTQDIHLVQAMILKKLSSVSRARFAELNTSHLPTDWFSFHIRQLKKLEMIERQSSGEYYLTEKGKRFSLLINAQDFAIYEGAKNSVLVVVRKNNKLLIQKRLIHPFYGFFEFPTERIQFGESMFEAAQRVLDAELGIKGESIFKGVNHKVEVDEENNATDDKYFFIIEILKFEGDVKTTFPDGENHWLSKEEILSLEKTHFDLEDNLSTLEEGKSMIREVRGIPKDY